MTCAVAIMRTMQRLRQYQRHQTIGRLQAGTFHTEVAPYFNVHSSTVICLLRRYQDNGSVEDQQRSCVQRGYMAREDRYIIVQTSRDRFQTAE